MRNSKRKKNTGTKKIIIALLTAIMLVASIASFTALATTEGAGYVSVVGAVDIYVPSDSGTRVNFVSDDEQAFELEVNDSDTYESDESFTDDLNTESSDSNFYTQDDDPSYIESTSDPEDGYVHDYYCELDEYIECLCTCDNYCGDDCICECFHCESYYIEIEALAEFIVTDWGGLLDAFTNLMSTDGPYTVNVAGSITMEAQLNIPAGRTVNLGGGGRLYQPTANQRHFSVDGRLILNGITL